MLVLAVTWFGTWPGAICAADLSLQDRMVVQLTKPMQSIVDGRPLRDAINSIAEQAHLNVWLDRRVDPSVPVALGPLGPTAFASLQQLAKSSGCVVMPIANVILIGRQKWVDQTTTTLMSLTLDDSSPRQSIHWDDLTTPQEALAAAVAGDVELDNDLPHDLWPAIDWHDLDPRVAVALILAQFDLRPDSTESISKLTTVPTTGRGQFTRQYALSLNNSDFRKAFLSATKTGRSKVTGRVKVDGETVSATGSAAAHRTALTAALTSIRPKSVDIDRSTFTIKRLRTSAMNAFAQLAKLAGRTCQIEPAAQEACQKPVSVEGTDLTLRELTNRVAAEVGVTVSWSVDTIVISALTGPGE